VPDCPVFGAGKPNLALQSHRREGEDEFRIPVAVLRTPVFAGVLSCVAPRAPDRCRSAAA
jgi:hypothetical protein